jgi:transcriptional regulator with XRE-family HTH domain
MQKSVHTKEYKALRAELRAAREAAGLSQRDLAARLGVPHSWVAKVEAGERRIDVVELIWLASACGEDASRIVSRIKLRQK